MSELFLCFVSIYSVFINILLELYTVVVRFSIYVTIYTYLTYIYSFCCYSDSYHTPLENLFLHFGSNLNMISLVEHSHFNEQFNSIDRLDRVSSDLYIVETINP